MREVQADLRGGPQPRHGQATQPHLTPLQEQVRTFEEYLAIKYYY